MISQIVHVAKLDGKTIKTTWAESLPELKVAKQRFQHEGAKEVKVFTGKGPFGGLGAKYRIVGYWP